jgi:hypothetical protein
MRLVDEYDWVDTGGFRAGTREMGRHRTEVTEATEGVRLVDEYDWWALVASVRETREMGKHRTEVTVVTEG